MPGETRAPLEVMRKTIAGVLQDVHVALPGQVVSFNQSTGLADVQVMVTHPVWDDDNELTYEDIGVLPGVPVAWPRGGGFIATFPIAVGDTGLLVFCSTPTGEFRATGQRSNPADASRHDIGWPVFIPGFSADVKAPAASCYQAGAMVIGSETGAGQVIIKAGEIDIGTGATHPAAFGDTNDTNMSALSTALGKIKIDIAALATGLGTLGVTVTPTFTAAPIFTATAATVAKVK
jgi:hypothetical protein